MMVVNTRTISRDTADEVLDKAVQYAAAAGERENGVRNLAQEAL